MNDRRIIIVGGPRRGKSTISRRLREECGIPTFCGDPLSKVKEPQEGVIYLPEGLGWSEGSQYIAETWFTMKAPWCCEGQAMARALRKWRGNPSGVEIYLLLNAVARCTPPQEAMHKAVITVWREIAHRYPHAVILPSAMDPALEAACRP